MYFFHHINCSHPSVKTQLRCQTITIITKQKRGCRKGTHRMTSGEKKSKKMSESMSKGFHHTVCAEWSRRQEVPGSIPGAHKKLNSCPSGMGINLKNNPLTARSRKLFSQLGDFENQIQKTKQKGIGDGDDVSRKIPKRKEFRRGSSERRPDDASRQTGGGVSPGSFPGVFRFFFFGPIQSISVVPLRSIERDLQRVHFWPFGSTIFWHKTTKQQSKAP